MISCNLKYLGAAALLLALAGCETKSAMPKILTSPYDPQDMRLVIKGQNANDALDSSAKIVSFLDDLDAPSAANIKGRINMLLNNPNAKLAGLGGIQSRAGLMSARATLDGPGNFAGPMTEFDVKGKIQDSVWGESGFYYKPGDPMHMWVQMITTAKRTAGGSTKVEQWAEMFRVEISTGAQVEARNDTDSNDVFPAFADDAFPVSASMAGMHRFKLWAVGNNVRVTNYWIDDNYNPVNGPVYLPSKQYTSTNHPPKFANIFAANPKACIDMMFKLNPDLDVSAGGALDNGELPAGSVPPYYCLGRCMDPPIVNTK